MFSVRITKEGGESRDFPLEIYKSSIFHGSDWIPCGSFFVPEEANDFMGADHGAETIVYAFHEGQVTRDRIEDETGYVNWELLLDGKPSNHEQFSREMMSKLGANYYNIPTSLDHKYHGCGNGIVTLDKKTREVLDFSYTDDNLNPIEDQNIEMCRDAGRKIKEDEQTVTYRANFSSYQICLF